MTRTEIIEELKKYFSIAELVCPHTLSAFGERSWQFIRTEQLETLLLLRTRILNATMTINNYPKGKWTQRGLRCNMCQIVYSKKSIYLSAHVLGCGDDFDAKGFTAEQTRQKIRDNSNLLPYPIRLEKNVSWVHLDTIDYCNGKVINEFDG